MMRHERGPGAGPTLAFTGRQVLLRVTRRRNTGRFAGWHIGRFAFVGRRTGGVIAAIGAGLACRMLRADLLAVRVRERANALADAVLTRFERVLALVDLIDNR